MRVTLSSATSGSVNSDSGVRNLSANGTTFSAWVYLPAGNNGNSWQASLGAHDANYAYLSGPMTALTANNWTLITFTPPPDYLPAMRSLFVYVFSVGSTGTNYVYVDDVQQGASIWTDETSVRFTASVSDADASDTDQLCIEAKPVGNAFTNTEDSCGTGVSYSGSPVTAVHTIGSLTNGTQYHWQARVKDAAGVYSSWVAYGGNKDSVTASPDFGIDTGAPSTGAVRDGATQGVDASLNDGSLNTLGGNWSGFSDAVSGIARYEYSIGTSPGGTQVANWTSTNLTEVTRSGLTLRTTETYYFNVRAVDLLGNTSSVISSNGVTVAPTLNFGVSTTSIVFDPMNTLNSYTPPTKSLDVTTSTNAYSGYVVRQYTSGPLTSGSSTIPNYSGTYASPTTWAGTGFGYTSSDTAIQSSGNIFSGATKYSRFSTTPPGDIVADHTSSVSGTPVSSEVFTLTYKVVGSGATPSGTYSTVICLGATAIY